MNLEKQQTLDMALRTLYEKLLPYKEAIAPKNYTGNGDFDAIVQLIGIDFMCMIRGSVTTANVGVIQSKIKGYPNPNKWPILLVAKYISPTIVAGLSSNGINTLDCAGNCDIRYSNSYRGMLNLVNKGEKNVIPTEKRSLAFNDAGLKLIFYLLQDAENVNRPYREIRKATGISLGAIKNVFGDLVETKFILQNNGRTLTNRKTLLDYWVSNYNYRLKPKLLLNKMTFRTSALRAKWMEMSLPEGMWWGGEGGAHKIDAYLEPGTFDIYTDIPAGNLARTGFVKQDEEGEIRIYRKFWNWDTDNQLAPLTLIYADLMGTGNSRCVETAERLLGNERYHHK